MKKGIVLGVFALFVSVLQAAASIDSNRFASQLVDRAMKVLGESGVCSFYNDPFKSEKSDFAAIDKRLQELFVDSQRLLGIPEAKLLPVVGFDKHKHGNFSYSKNAGALTTTQLIAINNDLGETGKAFGLNQPYGLVRQVALHESTHAKYNDPLIKTIIDLHSISKFIFIFLAFIFLVLCVILAIFNSAFKLRVFSGLIFVFVFIFISFGKPILNKLDDKIFNWFEKYTEQRAELTALENLQCYECAQEAICGNYFATEEFEKNTGYISVKRIEDFVNKFKCENKICDAHKNIKERKSFKLKKADGTVLKEFKVLTLEQVGAFK